ncbi:carboxyl transferase domain-containing protein [Flexivirga caeni]|uniref:Acyl-CoA carboxylase subunit beta n=1 Tax=Flexivirga caeni TaxID=2294115 RepID=A0A3M9MBB4_9MICO|nr:carboxyl transferase domain-containing protein [Flexivirga caeni]RNI22143.1 acyl-CoA carboxylase subunit beta [Flexivirga caeni]
MAQETVSDGSLVARRRIALLVDDESFVEDGRASAVADGIVTGSALIDGRPVVVVASAPRTGPWSAQAIDKIERGAASAVRRGVPVCWLLDGAADPDPAGVANGPGIDRIAQQAVALSQRAPQLCCVFGTLVGDRALLPGLTDVVILVDGAAVLSLGSVDAAEAVDGEHVSLVELGGARMHCTVSGSGDLLAADDADAIELARLYLSYVPARRGEQPPAYLGEEPVRPLTADTVPAGASRPFDIHDLIAGIADADSFFELQPLLAPGLVTGFARLDGRSVGIVANNSAAGGGVLGADCAQKAAGFVRRCAAHSIPVLHLVDLPGPTAGVAAARGGVLRRGTDLLAVVTAAPVPHVCVIVRTGYAAGLLAMCGPRSETEARLALPTAVVDGRTAQEAAVGLLVDAVVPLPELRAELLRRLAHAAKR